MPEISVATVADRQPIVDLLVAAFPDDPILRFFFPGEADYAAHAATFFGHLFDKRVGRGSIWTIGHAAVAIWEPPGPSGEPVPALELPAGSAARVKAYDEALNAALPETPFWYLSVVGTAPAAAGRGRGRAVMRAGLERAAAEGLPAVLETSNPGNVGLYQRAGWSVLRELAEPLPIWVMTR